MKHYQEGVNSSVLLLEGVDILTGQGIDFLTDFQQWLPESDAKQRECPLPQGPFATMP